MSFSLIICLHASAEAIVIYGDSQHNPQIQRKLVKTILSFGPSIVLRVGDLVDNGNNPALWKVFNAIHAPLMKTAEYFPALGNHEHGSPLYFANFPFLNNRRWYSIDRLAIHFVILDSNSALDLESVQYKWLQSDLEHMGDSNRFVIVIFHHPLFDVSKRHKGDEKNLKPVVLPLFERFGVSGVFSGHSHNYQRFGQNGIYFIVTGGGGSHLYAQTRADPHLQKFSPAYHFCLLTPDDDFVNVKVIDINSGIIDEFKIPARVNKYKTLELVH